MRVIDLPLAQLREALWNPNQMDTSTLARLKRSLSRFGPVQNLVVRPIGEDLYEVLSGNQRLRVLWELDFSSVPCVVVELDDAPARLLAQALNRVMGADEPSLKIQLLRDLLDQVSPEEVLALLPESAESLAALGNLASQDLAGALRDWDRAKQVRLRHRTFQLVPAQLELVDRAVAVASRSEGPMDPGNPNPQGNALFRICQAYLNAKGVDSHD